MSAIKISVSLDETDVRWLKRVAHKQKATVSGLLGAAVERMRREEALDEVIAYLGNAAVLDEGELEEIEGEWSG